MDSAGRIGWDRTGDVYTGAQIVKAGLFDGYPECPFSLHAVWQDAMDRGRMFGASHAGHWADVGHPEGIAQAEAMLREADDV